MTDIQSPFSNPAAVSNYVDETPGKVPGLADLHRMTMLLLSETAPADARILVVGAGGGMELKAFAEAQAGWTFAGVDPSAAMLELARHITEQFMGRVELLEGTVEVAPPGRFDGAVCLLTLHFLDKAERLSTLKEIASRVSPGARLVVAHHSTADGDAVHWLARSAAFANRTSEDWDKARISAAAMAERLYLLTAGEEEALMREAGFSNIELFYAAFSFRGWVATAKAI